MQTRRRGGSWISGPWFARAFWFALAACGDDTIAGDTQDAANAERDLSVCQADLRWFDRCEGDPEFGYDRGWGEDECPLLPWQLVEPAFIRADAACFSDLACDQFDDACADAGYRALHLEPAEIAKDALSKRCGERAQVCDKPDDEKQVKDVCEWLPILTSAGRMIFSACLEESCERIYACAYGP
jgi:hypothetical protein